MVAVGARPAVVNDRAGPVRAAPEDMRRICACAVATWVCACTGNDAVRQLPDTRPPPPAVDAGTSSVGPAQADAGEPDTDGGLTVAPDGGAGLVDGGPSASCADL